MFKKLRDEVPDLDAKLKRYCQYHIANYDKFCSGEIDYSPKMMFEFLKTHFLKNKTIFSKVIDIGVGNGFFFSELAKLHPSISYIGIDINPYIIQHNQQVFPHLQFVSGDTHSILKSLADTSPVLIYAMASLEHFLEEELIQLLLIIQNYFPNSMFIFSGHFDPIISSLSDRHSKKRMVNGILPKYSHNYLHLLKNAQFTMIDVCALHLKNNALEDRTIIYFICAQPTGCSNISDELEG